MTETPRERTDRQGRSASPSGDLLFGAGAAAAALVVSLVVVVGTWYVLPLRRARDPRISRGE